MYVDVNGRCGSGDPVGFGADVAEKPPMATVSASHYQRARGDDCKPAMHAW